MSGNNSEDKLHLQQEEVQCQAAQTQACLMEEYCHQCAEKKAAEEKKAEEERRAEGERKAMEERCQLAMERAKREEEEAAAAIAATSAAEKGKGHASSVCGTPTQTRR